PRPGPRGGRPRGRGRAGGACRWCVLRRSSGQPTSVFGGVPAGRTKLLLLGPCGALILAETERVAASAAGGSVPRRFGAAWLGPPQRCGCMADLISFRALGCLELTRGSSPLRVVGRRRRLALFAYLRLSRAPFQSRDIVQAMFWPECDQNRARHSLNT